MAEEKTSFILYADLLHTVKKMPDDKAGILLKTILEYVNDLNPQVEDLLVDLVFEPIRQQLKRDLKSYEHRKQERSINGRMGNLKKWNLDLYEKVEKGILSLEIAEKEALNRKKSHSDEENRIPIDPDKILSPAIANVADNDNVNDTVNGNVNVTVNDINKSSTKKTKSQFSVASLSVQQSAEITKEVKSFFLDKYAESYGTDYYFQAKDGKKVQDLVKKIYFKMKDKESRNFSKVEIIESCQFFISASMLVADNWLKSNFNLSNLDSKFNDIYTQIKNYNENGKKLTRNSIYQQAKSVFAGD